MSCNTDKLYGSLTWCKGQAILPGIRGRIYYISKKDIVKWPKLPETATAGNTAKIVTYDGDFTLAADTKWKYIDIISTKSPVTSETQGEVPCVTSLNKATFKHPGTEEEATAFAKEANNDDLVYQVQTRKGKFRVIGNEMFETVTKISQEIGGAVTDEAGTTIEVEVTDVCPAPFYTGVIETKEGDIDAGTGDLTPPTP